MSAQANAARTDPALVIDDPVPRHVVVPIQRRQAVAHHAGSAIAHNHGDLTVGRHLAAGNLPHHIQHARIHRDNVVRSFSRVQSRGSSLYPGYSHW